MFYQQAWFWITFVVVALMVILGSRAVRTYKKMEAEEKEEKRKRHEQAPSLLGKRFPFKGPLYHISFCVEKIDETEKVLEGKAIIFLGYSYEVKSLNDRNPRDIRVGVFYKLGGQRIFEVKHYDLYRNRPEGLDLWQCDVTHAQAVTEIPLDER